MLELLQLSHTSVRRGQDSEKPDLDGVSFAVPAGHLMAIVGPVGCGNGELLSMLSGQSKADRGALLWRGLDVAKRQIPANDIGYVPADDNCVHDLLSVKENIVSAMFLRVAGVSKPDALHKANHLLSGLGMENIGREKAGTLSLAMRRRLKLAVALVSDPALILCEGLTDGLDARSEREIIALLKFVAQDHPSRAVIHATRSLSNLPAYDSVVILHEGRVCFHGPARAVTHYFTVKTIEDLFPRLAMRPAQRWGDSWDRHRDSYYDAFKIGATGDSLAPASDDEESAGGEGRVRFSKSPSPKSSDDEEDVEKSTLPAVDPIRPTTPLPSTLAQVTHLARRRWSLLRRNKRDWRTHVLMLAGFPVLTLLLVWPNLNYLKQGAATPGSLAPDILWPSAFTCMMTVFIQIIMVLYMSVRNGAREIAGDRAAYERERIGGLRPTAYFLGKLTYVVPLFLLQTFWLGMFMEMITGGLPGNVGLRLALLVMTGAASTMICLGISANSRSGERAMSICLTLAFLQILLAGALQGFPRLLGNVIHPFITAYHGWSGSMDAMKDTAAFPAISQLVRTWFATPAQALTWLSVHLALGALLCVIGIRRKQRRD